MVATRSLVNATVRSEKLYGFIVRYFLTVGFEEQRWNTINPNSPIFFFFSLAKVHNFGSDDTEFFDLTNAYIKSQMNRFDER